MGYVQNSKELLQERGGAVRYIGFTPEGPSAGVGELIATGAFDTTTICSNLMRPLTSGVYQRLMAEAFPEIDTVFRDGAGGGSAVAQSRAFGSVRGRGAGGDA